MHRDPSDLKRVMQRALDDPHSLSELGKRGYLYSEDGSIPSVEENVKTIIAHYKLIIRELQEDRS